MTHNPDDLNIWLNFISQLKKPQSNIKKKNPKKTERLDITVRQPVEILSSKAWEAFANQVDKINYKRYEYATHQSPEAIKTKLEVQFSTSPTKLFDQPLNITPVQVLDRLDKKQLLKTKPYNLHSIDLHGHTLPQAYEKLKSTFAQALRMKIRILHVITGKGARTLDEERPTLRSIFANWMQEPEFFSKIEKIRKAPKEYGGDGAFLIYLKKS